MGGSGGGFLRSLDILFAFKLGVTTFYEIGNKNIYFFLFPVDLGGLRRAYPVFLQGDTLDAIYFLIRGVLLYDFRLRPSFLDRLSSVKFNLSVSSNSSLSLLDLDLGRLPEKYLGV